MDVNKGSGAASGSDTPPAPSGSYTAAATNQTDREATSGGSVPSTPGAGSSSGYDDGWGAPSPSRDASEGTSGGGSAAPAAGSSTQFLGSVQDVLDPAILEELVAGGVTAQGQGLEQRLQALQRASEQLKRVDSDLAARSRALRQRAGSMRAADPQ